MNYIYLRYSLVTTAIALTNKPLLYEQDLESLLPNLDPDYASLSIKEQHERAESLGYDYIAKPITKSGQYQAASDVLESLKVDEDNVASREGYSALPGIALLGTGLDMMDGASRTRICVENKNIAISSN